jgi:concentrative nucleoside transporter, CNT family
MNTFIGCVCFLLLSSFTWAQENLTGKWSIKEIENIPNQTKLESFPGDFLEFLEYQDFDIDMQSDYLKRITRLNRKFRIHIASLDLEQNGVWTYSKDTLCLRLKRIQRQKRIDSLFHADNDILFFSNRDTVARLSEDAFSFSEIVYRFRLKVIGADSLLMQNKQFRIIMVKDNGMPVLSAHISLVSVSRGLLGILVLILISFLLSRNRKAISWRLVIVGLSAQIILAVCILYIPFMQMFFEFLGKIFIKVLDFSHDGSSFLLGSLLDTNTYGYIFIFQILPTIIFFSALTSILFYLGIIQKIVYLLAWLMVKALKISGAESLSVAGNIFLGQTESPLMIKAYLSRMNNSEILLVMIGGMATVAGGVMAAYIGFLGGDDPQQRLLFAKHLLAASIMAAPGAVVASKILLPQDQKIDNTIEISKDKIGDNLLDAMARGTTEGLKLAANVGAMLLVFFAVISMLNYIMLKLGSMTQINGWVADISDGRFDVLSLQFVLGYVFSPLMWLLGVCSQDISLVGSLLGEKIIASEFIAYISLGTMKGGAVFAEYKSMIMATYMLCGFANFASIGIQIGGIGTLAPGKRVVLSRFGIRALIGGTIASLFSATIIGMIMG